MRGFGPCRCRMSRAGGCRMSTETEGGFIIHEPEAPTLLLTHGLTSAQILWLALDYQSRTGLRASDIDALAPTTNVHRRGDR